MSDPPDMFNLIPDSFLAGKAQEQEDPPAIVDSSNEAKEEFSCRVRMAVSELSVEEEMDAFKHPRYAQDKQHFGVNNLE